MKSIATEFIGGPNLPIQCSESIHERLIEIYWDKKNIEEFLPKIATYSSQKELVAITLAQLSIIEKQLIRLMREIAESDNNSKTNLH